MNDTEMIQKKYSLKEIVNHIPQEYRKLFIKNMMTIDSYNYIYFFKSKNYKKRYFRGKLNIDELYCFSKTQDYASKKLNELIINLYTEK